MQNKDEADEGGQGQTLSDLIFDLLQKREPIKYPTGYYQKVGDALYIHFSDKPYMRKYVNKYLTLYVDGDNHDEIVGIVLDNISKIDLFNVKLLPDNEKRSYNSNDKN